MNQRNVYLIVNLLLGVLVLLSYIAFLPLVKRQHLWAGIPPNIQNIFWLCILTAVVCFIGAFVSMYRSNKTFSVWLWVGMVMFYVGAMLWAPMLWLENRVFVFLALLMTAMGALTMSMNGPENMARLLLTIVFLHTFFMDTIVWYTEYLKVSS